ncbi:MAG: GNAT family N-acetyltransferase [Candidatus Promineifilaceae bacterium]|nr:GNAT family N-acetyltransferase [Candidatus Promineifilaceae bacterium]
MKIVPFEDEMLPQAAGLLAQQQKRCRISLPELPARFEEREAALEAVSALWDKKHREGFAALVGEQMVAYLIGDRVVENASWGRSGWMRPAGCAYDVGAGVEVVRDLYAALGERWVDQGIFIHVAQVLTADPALVQAWHSLSFGIEQVHGLLNLEARGGSRPELPHGLSIRRARPGDGPVLRAFADVIWRVQVRAPVWGVMIPEAAGETAAAWADMVQDDEALVWIAFRQDEAVGVQAFWPADLDDRQLYIPEGCVHLSVAGTKPETRGEGIGSVMTRFTLAEVRQMGFQYCEADWRSTNLLASRFWPRRGFRPAVYRLSRRVDERILWARGQEA